MSSNISNSEIGLDFQGPFLAAGELSCCLRGTGAALEHARKRGFLPKRRIDTQVSALQNKLPRDILVAVTKYLDVKSVTCFTSVCLEHRLFKAQAFRERSDAAEMVLTRYLNDEISAFHADDIAVLHTVRSLNFENLDLVVDDVRKIVEICPELREVNLKGELGDEGLEELLPIKSQLTSLTFTHGNIDHWTNPLDDQLPMLTKAGFETLAQFQKLKKLALSSFGKSNQQGLDEGLRQISALTRLESLSIYHYALKNFLNEQIIGQWAKSFKNLKELELTSAFMKPEFLHYLSLFPNLESLTIHVHATRDLFPVLASLKKLKRLIIDDVHEGKESYSLAELSSLTKLEDLTIGLSYKPQKNEISEFLSGLTYLKFLQIRASHVEEEELVSALSNLDRLEQLNVDGFDITGAEFHRLTNLTNLWFLKLENCKELSDQIFTVFPKWKKLEVVELENCPELTAKIEDQMGKLEELKDISFKRCRELTDAVFTLLAKASKLQIVRFEHCSITGKNIQVMEGLSSLSEIIFEDCYKLTGEVFPILPKWKSLEVVKFHTCPKLTYEGMKGTLKYLQELEIYQCPRIQLEKFSSFIASSPVLQKVALGAQSIQDNWLQVLASTKIEFLELAGASKVTDKGLQFLQGHPTLIELDIKRKTGTTKAGRKALFDSIPDLYLTCNRKVAPDDGNESDDYSSSDSDVDDSDE